MASNGYGNSGSKIHVLYKIVNSECDKSDTCFNAFEMSRGPRGTSLANVKQNCTALYGLNHLGPEGYHWRVCVEDKAAPGEGGVGGGCSWWDIQDENASLPVKTAPQSAIKKFLDAASGKKKASGDEIDTIDQAAKVAKGAFKTLGKTLNAAVTGEASPDSGPPITVVAFKLLDLCRMHDDFSQKHQGGRGGAMPAVGGAPAASVNHSRRDSATMRAQAPARQAHPPARVQTAPARQAPAAHGRPAPQQQPQKQPPAQQQQYQRQQRAPAQQTASLMDFGDAPAAVKEPLHHASSSPSLFGPPSSGTSSVNPNESKAEKLKREYAEKAQKANRVWDEVDQRWVEVDPSAVGSVRATKSAPPGGDHIDPNKKKEVGISLDPANAVGKSASVQAAVNKRVNDMRESQAKALEEVRAREAKKKVEEAEEDAVRKKLEPQIKTWSEEHGKKKQLRALLASLHTILWPGANWKQVTIGDLLDDKKMVRCYHKASRVVHPDKTHHLPAEQRFMAKRIFDALTQAKSDYDNGAK